MSLADDMAADIQAETPAPGRKSLSQSMAEDTATPKVSSNPVAQMPPMDPSAGGSSLTIGIPATPWNNAHTIDTGIKTPQWLDRALSGAGKAVSDLGTGVRQIVGGASPADYDQTKRLDAPLMNTGAGQAGYVAGNIAATTLPLSALSRAPVVGGIARSLVNPSTYGASIASGAINGALQPVGTGDNRAGNAVMGAGAGVVSNGLVNAVGRLAQPTQQVIDPLRARAVQTLQNAGIPLDAAQLTGSTFLNRMRSSFADNPFTAGRQADLVGAQKAAFNNAALQTIGEQGPAATQEVMRRADDRIGGVFQDILGRNNVQVTDPLLTRVGAIQQAANDEEKTAVSNIANRFINSVGADGAVPGQVAYGIKKDLDRLANSPDTTLAYHARQLRSAVMDGINDSLTGADQAAFAQARGQFRNMKTIEGAIDKEGAGNISPSQLANILGQKRNRAASVYGRGDQDLVNLAQAGKMLIPDKLPNSGTTARATMQLLAPAVGAAAGGAYDAYGGDYGSAGLKALGTAGAMIAAPRVAQRIINSPAASQYLQGGIQNAPLRSLLMLPNENPAVGATLRRLPGAVIEAQ